MYKELVPGVFEYQFPDDLAKELIKYLDKIPEDKWQQSLVGPGQKRLNIRSSEGYDLDNGAPLLSSKVRKYFYDSVNHYVKHFQTTVIQDESLQVLKYENSDSYSYHTDSGWDIYRTVSALIYLNPNKYEGGHTHFKYFDLSVKPDKPAIVLFPSNYLYLHAAMPVTKGKKYVIVTWLNDRPRDLMSNDHGNGCACSR